MIPIAPVLGILLFKGINKLLKLEVIENPYSLRNMLEIKQDQIDQSLDQLEEYKRIINDLQYRQEYSPIILESKIEVDTDSDQEIHELKIKRAFELLCHNQSLRDSVFVEKEEWGGKTYYTLEIAIVSKDFLRYRPKINTGRCGDELKFPFRF